jgi:hypothetical protein
MREKIENIAKSIADVDSNNTHETVANIKLRLSLSHEVSEADEMIAHEEDSQLVENLLSVDGIIHKWFGMD